MRQVILVPESTDLDEPYRQYWENFVVRVRMALLNDGLACQLLVADRNVSTPTQSRAATETPQP